jgi:hypothetical protein
LDRRKERRDEGKERKMSILWIGETMFLSGNGSYRIPLSALEGGVEASFLGPKIALVTN